MSAMLTELEKEGRRPNLPPSLILHRGLSQDGDSGGDVEAEPAGFKSTTNENRLQSPF